MMLVGNTAYHLLSNWGPLHMSMRCNVVDLNYCYCSAQCDEALAEAQEQAGSSAQVGTFPCFVKPIVSCIPGGNNYMPLQMLFLRVAVLTAIV